MYNPPRFQSTDMSEVFELMDQNPFATVITVVDGSPMISHLPLTPQRKDNDIELIGHLARANPQWKSFANSVVTVIFHGPHTYITPKWYAKDDVPTWNYSTVHVMGRVELIETQQGIIDCLKTLTAHVERHWPSGWDFFIPDDLAGDALSKGILGFRIKIEEINYKKKLSQNRSAADHAGVLRGLEGRKDENSQKVLAEMKKLYTNTTMTK